MTPKAMKTRKPLRKQPTSPSFTSIFSSLTKTSSSSNSTVTPESYARHRRNSSQTQAKKAPSRTQQLPTPKTTPPESPTNGRPDVFAYMEEDNDSDEGSEHSSSNEEEEDEEDEEDGSDDEEHRPIQGSSSPKPIPAATYNATSMDYIPRTPDHRRISTSLHSDSGISVRSSSPEHDSPWPARKPVYRQQQPRDSSVSSGYSYRQTKRPPRLEWDMNSSPESFYTHPSRSVPQTATFKPLQPALPPIQSLVQYDQLPQTSSALASIPGPNTTSIAPHLSATIDAHTRPVYRRFETLTNRLLLQLQAELQVIESDLAAIDAAIEQDSNSNKSSSPSSPSAPREKHSLQQRNHHLEYRRAEVFGLLAAKLEQYHRALGAYHVLSGIPAAEAESVDGMRELVRGSEMDDSFLARLEDLAVLSVKASGQAGVADGTMVAQRNATAFGTGEMVVKDRDRESALFTGGAVLMTILAFKFVPRFIARVVLGGVIAAGMIGCGMLPELERGRWRKQAGLYTAAVVVLATIVA